MNNEKVPKGAFSLPLSFTVYMWKYLLYIVNVIFVLSFFIILLIIFTGGVRIDLLDIDFISLKRPVFFLFTAILVKRRIGTRNAEKNKIFENYYAFSLCIFFVSLLFYSIISAKIVPDLVPNGDEPHFLMLTASIMKDGDLNLRNNYDKGEYYEFYPGYLEPHARICEEEKIFSAHGIGFPVLLVPGYIVAGRYGASYIIAVLFAALTVVMFSLCYELTKNKMLSAGLSFLISFTVPLVLYSFQLYSETAAALIVAYLFLVSIKLNTENISVWKVFIIAVLLAYLPWLHVRYIIFFVIFSVYFCFRFGLKKAMPVVFSGIISLICVLLYMKHFFGTLSFTAQYAGGIDSGIKYLPKGLAGNLFDYRFGLLLYSPYYVFLGAGIYFLYRRKKKLLLWWSVVVIPFVISVSTYYHWHGGYCPPLRYILPVVPLFIIPLGYLLGEKRTILFYIVFLFFVVIGLVMKNIVINNTELMYNSEFAASGILDYIKQKGINLYWVYPSLFGMSLKDYILTGCLCLFSVLINLIPVCSRVKD